MILTNCRVFNGIEFLYNKSIVIKDDKIIDIADYYSNYDDDNVIDLDNAIVTPGFIDLQLNGCGGVLFNDNISIETLEQMHKTNLKYGCTSFLPTLITSSDEKIIESINLVNKINDKEKIGVLGLHLEGPYISIEKKGIHNPKYIRVLSDDIINFISNEGKDAVKIITIAPEKANISHLNALKNSSINISIGHTFATYDECFDKKDFFTHSTHLFNAMRGLDSREPGVVGYILERQDIYSGIIADGYHVSYPNIKLSKDLLKDKLFLVTDAVSPAGTDMEYFIFEGQKVYHKDGKCFGEDGTLGGSALTMIEGVKNLVQFSKISIEESLKMASTYPTHAIKVDNKYGYIKSNYIADLAIISDDFNIKGIVKNGEYTKY